MSKPQRIALIIGNGRYQNSRPLVNPVNDAALITQRLLDLGYEIVGGATSKNNTTALTAGMDLASVQMVALVGEFLAKVQPGATAVIYYAGHGLQVEGRNYLVPVDDTLDASLPDFGLVEIKPRIETLTGRVGEDGVAVVFLDACRDDPMSKEQRKRLLDLLDPAEKAEHGQEPEVSSTRSRGGLSTMKIAPASGSGRTFIGFATAPGDYAYDGKEGSKNSPFARALGKHLAIRGLDIEKFYDRVELDVRDTVLQEHGKVQDPWSETNLSRPVYLHPSSGWPVVVLGLLGGLAGLGICATIFDANGLGEVSGRPWIWFGGLLFGLVATFGTLKWGSGRPFDAFLTLVGPAIGFALALAIMKIIPVTAPSNIATREGASFEVASRVYFIVTLLGGGLYLVGIALLWMSDPPEWPKRPIQWLNRILTWALPFIVVGGLLLLESYISRANPLLTALALFTVMGGVIYAMSVALACRAQRGLFGQFGPITGAISVGLMMAVLFAMYASWTSRLGLPQEQSLFHLIGFGAFWHLLLGAQLGYCFAYYVPDHERVR